MPVQLHPDRGRDAGVCAEGHVRRCQRQVHVRAVLDWPPVQPDVPGLEREVESALQWVWLLRSCEREPAVHLRSWLRT